MKFMYVQMKKRGAARCLLNYGKVCSYFKGSPPSTMSIRLISCCRLVGRSMSAPI